MRTFGASFAAEILKARTKPFWTVAFRFLTGDVFTAGRVATIGGNVHTAILDRVGTIGAGSGRREPTQMDVPNCDLAYVNMPMRAGGLGQLTTGQRLSDLYTRTMQSVLSDIYLSIELADASIVQELMLPGVMQISSLGYLLGAQRVSSLAEKYLNATVHRTLSSVTYPFSRTTDLRQTLPIVFGTVQRSLARITKGRFVSNPLAGSGNLGGAVLKRAYADPGAPDETWTLTVVAGETIASTTTNANQAVSDRVSGYTANVFAQSFTPASGETLLGVTVRIRVNNALPLYSGGGTWYVALRSDSAGVPGALLSQVITSIPYTQRTYADFAAMFPSPVSLTGGTLYWIEVSSRFDSATGYSGIEWAKDTTNPYAGGSAYQGTAVIISDAPSLRTYSWTTPLATTDFVFGAITLAGGGSSFSFVGSVTGADGTGVVAVDSTSTSGFVTIKASDWVGDPAAGDTFTFQVNRSPTLAVLSESPTATPITSIGDVYWNDDLLAGTTISQLVDDLGDPGRYFGRETGGEAHSHAQQIVLSHALVVRDLELKLAKTGSPIYPVTVEIRKDAGNLPLGDVVAATYIDPVLISTTPAMVSAIFDPAPVLPAGRYWIIVTSSQSDDSNNYTIRQSNTEAYPLGAFMTFERDVQRYIVIGGTDLVFSLNAVTVTKELSIDDGTGINVARVTFDAEIPEDVVVTANVVGIKDDGSGTYTGVAAALLTVPGHVFHWLLTRAGVPTADIDLAGTFAASNAQYGSLHRFNGVSLDDLTYKQLFLKLAYQCCSVFTWWLTAQLKFVPDAYPTPVRTFTLDDIIPGSDRVPQIELTPMAMDEIINSLVGNYNRDPGSGRYKQTLARYAPESVGAFGVLKRTDLENMEFVKTEAQAKAILDHRLKRQALPAWRAAFTTLLPFIDMEPDDPVALDLTNAAAGDVLGGWDGSQTFQVEAMNLQPEIFGIDFVLREANISVNILDGDPTIIGVSSIVVLRDQTTGDLVDVNFGVTPLTQTTPSTSGGTPFDAILLSGGYYVYVDNGLLSASNTITPTDVLTWVGFPPMSIDGSGGLVVG